MNFETIVLIYIIIIGIITSYTDIKYYKIKNKHLLFFLLLYIPLLISYMFIFKISNIFFVNILISIVFIFIFHYSKYWKPGDGKLFFLYTLILFPQISDLSSIKILSNSFFIIMMALLLVIVLNLNKKLISVKNLNFNKIILKIVSLNYVYIIVYFLRYYFNQINPVFIFIIIFAINSIFKNKFLLKYNILITFILIVFNSKMFISYDYLRQMIIIVAYWSVINIFFVFLPSKIFIKNYFSHDLKEGMIIAESILDNKNIKIIDSNQILIKKDIENIKKLKIEHVKIKSHTFFAPYLFCGSLITFFFNINIFVIIQQLIM